MGRWASLAASVMDTGDPLYISVGTRRVSTPSSRKIKKAFSNSKALKFQKKQKRVPHGRDSDCNTTSHKP
nr:MAG TPA: hypothetical protein [Caudoviricetes sp.]